jgi:hypothetical protein
MPMLVGPMFLALRFLVLPSASPRSGPSLASSRKYHPAVHSSGALLASDAGLDPHRVCHALNDISQTNGFFRDETR